MKKLIPAGIFAIGVITSSFAHAADLGQPVYKAPPPPPVPVFSWTGFYVGGNVGYGWGTSKDDLSFLQTDPCGTVCGSPPNDLATFDATDSNKLNGVIGGVQAGYNWQVSNFLLGIETDIQASGQRGTTTFGGLILNGSVFNTIEGNNPATVTDTSQLRWFGTTRGRLGFVSDRWLIYGTGGVAYGGLKESGSIQPLNAFPPQTQNAPIVWDKSTTNVGWAAGAGVENAITQNLSWKLEYLYMDLGNTTANVSGGVGTTAGTAANCYAAPGAPLCSLFRFPPAGTVTSHFTDNIVRGGLNYQFH